MKKHIGIAVAAVLVACASGLPSVAQTTGSVSDKNVTIVRLRADDLRGKGIPLPTVTDHITSDAQATVRSDAALRAFLERNSVELNNVVAIETALDGSRIVYLK